MGGKKAFGLVLGVKFLASDSFTLYSFGLDTAWRAGRLMGQDFYRIAGSYDFWAARADRFRINVGDFNFGVYKQRKGNCHYWYGAAWVREWLWRAYCSSWDYPSIDQIWRASQALRAKMRGL